MKKYIILNINIILLSVTLSSCKKEWLDIKPDKGLAVPQTIVDYQAILDNSTIMNSYCTYAGNGGTDCFYIADEDLGSLMEYDRNVYSWADQINWYGESSLDWDGPFTIIEYANIVLNGIINLDQNKEAVKNLKGQASFYRAFAYYSLAQIFCKQYQIENASTDLGLPIRLNYDVNYINQRSTLFDLYRFIISDLEQAELLLPETSPYFTRPNNIAAQAMLAKVFLNLQEYNKSKDYADKVIRKMPSLADFNNSTQVSHDFEYKFPANGKGNPEIIFYAYAPGGYFNVNYLGNFIQANPELYDLYTDNDLRKEYFFSQSGGKLNFISSYTGIGYEFSGIATNEIYLIRAESNTRSGQLDDAIKDLNYLLKHRYKTGKAPTIKETNQKTLLHLILIERRKELAHTNNIRWEDLRRLNLDPEFSTTLNRTMNGQTYSLPPKSPKFVLNIPNSEIRNSNIGQNKR